MWSGIVGEGMVVRGGWVWRRGIVSSVRYSLMSRVLLLLPPPPTRYDLRGLGVVLLVFESSQLPSLHASKVEGLPTATLQTEEPYEWQVAAWAFLVRR